MDNTISLLQHENKELKESNCKLANQIEELENKLKMRTMKLEYKTMKDLDNHITECETRIKTVNEKIGNSEREIRENNFRLDYLETLFVKKVKEAEGSAIQNSEFYKFFKDHVIKSIEKKDEEKLKNKILLEKILILCKKLKKIQK